MISRLYCSKNELARQSILAPNLPKETFTKSLRLKVSPLFRTTKVRSRIAKTAITSLSIYIAPRSLSSEHPAEPIEIDPIRSILDVLIRSKSDENQSRVAERNFRLRSLSLRLVDIQKERNIYV